MNENSKIRKQIEDHFKKKLKLKKINNIKFKLINKIIKNGF